MFQAPSRATHRAPGRAVVNYRGIAAPVGRGVGGVAVLGAVTATGSLVAIPEAEALAPVELSALAPGAPIAPTEFSPEVQREIDTYTALVLRPGARGDAITYLQNRLNDRGAGLPVDGYYNVATRKAVEAVQTNGGVTVDGAVGPSTWDLLVNTSAEEVPAVLPEAAPAPRTTEPAAASTSSVGSDEARYAPQVLRYGSRGEAVSFLQARLNDRGAGIPVDGRFGPATRSAVRTLQSNGGVGVDGVVGPVTWDILFNTGADEVPAKAKSSAPATSPDSGGSSYVGTVLRYGDRGAAVTYLQARLNDRGADIPEDGRFGPATRASVRALQSNAGISRDGVVGPRTWDVLVNSSAEDVPARSTGSTQASGFNSKTMVAQAKSYLGTPYVWGGASSSGMDCSGLVKLVYNAHGIEVPRVARNQVYGGRIIPKSEAKPGDLVAFSSGNWGHIGIYIGNGQIIDAGNSKGRVVQRDIWNSPHVYVTYR
ncbi:hydrolase [Brachybacterium phenoliresistens]|uniref:Hydrolase n=1 Tax=Brachybacterium phenoliresistens TaxID=396014 RepID=Z9JR50_9MICO|nr:hydrolase [Brachybacterium phenoliresistens]